MKEKSNERGISLRVLVISIIVLLIILALILSIVLKNRIATKSADIVDSYSNSQEQEVKINDIDKEIIINDIDEEKRKEIIEMLNSKYGENHFEVVNFKYTPKKVINGGDYFTTEAERNDYTIKLTTEDFEQYFNFELNTKADDLILKLEEKYNYNAYITDKLKSVNKNITEVRYSVDDYNGYHTRKNKIGYGYFGNKNDDYNFYNLKGEHYLSDPDRCNYMFSDNIFGYIPTETDINNLVHDLDITCNYSKENNFVENHKLEIKQIYELIKNTFPRIPKGMGITHISINFENGIFINIKPLTKEIIVQGEEYGEDYKLNWQRILD